MLKRLDKNIELAAKIIKIFDIEYSNPKCTLDYETPLELLISTQLAAQCTDARVNIVTKDLYKKYPDVYAFASADLKELQEDIKSTGFFRNKAKNIIGCANMLVSDYKGEVPGSMEELLRLPGVGRKTANLVLGDYFNIPGVVVDTHATRLSQRFGFTESSDPKKIEFELMEILPKDKWTRFCHQLVEHGRKYCTARKPDCENCPITEFCPKIGV